MNAPQGCLKCGPEIPIEVCPHLVHHYWVSYVYSGPVTGMGFGSCALNRNTPLHDSFEVISAAEHLRTVVLPQSGAPEPTSLAILSWQRFEERS